MAKIISLEQNEKALELLSDLLEMDEGLSSWEVEFICSLDEWKGLFTEKQFETLERVHEIHF